jgi:NAD(P)-dependent dehydrogenase (short-subunit alcohol dehydrogenase family)
MQYERAEMDVLTGKVAVVTGAASGIGSAMASAFAAAGMHVVLADRNEQGLAHVLETIEAHGGAGIAVPTDCGDRDSVGALRDATLAAFGAAHVVCNNAGLGGGGALINGRLDLARWREVMNVNYFGHIYGIEAFLPILLEQDEGHIVNTASRQGLVSSGGNAGYCASKSAAIALSETLHLELSSIGSKVGISILCPGGVRTGMLRPPEELPADTDAETRTLLTQRYRDAAEPADVAALVVRAVLANRLYVLTHAETIEWMTARTDRIAGDVAALGTIR